MCGICGIVEPPNAASNDLERSILKMVETLKRRGPDGDGHDIFAPPRAARPVALGHTRLAIIDLSDAGLQPMASADGLVHLVFNGEIYNFRSLRKSLEAKGRRFNSKTDSEVVLRLYEDRGEDFVRDLEGMFALAILDLRVQRLVLARDPLGVKPLFYAERAGGGLVFGSEIKAILASGRYSPDVDWQAVSDYFTFLYVPQPETAFKGIRQLPAAHTMTMDLRSGRSTTARYWHVKRRPEIERASFGEAKEMLRATLGRIVERQLVSDVPLGVFLSAGADSTVLTGLARKHGDVHTYTVVFDDPALAFYDEREGARAASEHLGTIHHELPIAKIDPFDLLDTLGLFDQPFANPTAHLMRVLSQKARERITVALCGAGGDELFAGYPRYGAERLARLLRSVPSGLLRSVGRGLSHVRDSHRTMHLRRLKEFFLGYDDDAIERFVNWTYYVDEPTKARLLGGRRAEPASRVIRALATASELTDADARMLEVDVGSFLVDNLLEYTDKASMAVGLEMRVPLLDHNFVEMSLNLPFRYKMRGRKTKVVFREAFADLFAPKLAKLPKRGFNAPLAMYMRDLDAYFDAPHALRDRFGKIGATWKGGLVDWNEIQRLRGEHRDGRADNSSELFGIMMFDRWWAEYIEGRAGPSLVASSLGA